MTIEHDAVARSVAGLAIGQVQAGQEREKNLAYDRLGEFDQQYQVPITGVATDQLVWQEVEITFQWPFHSATAKGQRDSSFTVPHFTFGVALENVEGDPPIVTAVVREWIRDDSEAVTGARVAIGVYRPGGGGGPAG